jgi:hypothetical protein
MRVGLPICVLDKEVVKIASHLASGVVERRHPAVATRHVRREKDHGLFFKRASNRFCLPVWWRGGGSLRCIVVYSV